MSPVTGSGRQRATWIAPPAMRTSTTSRTTSPTARRRARPERGDGPVVIGTPGVAPTLLPEVGAEGVRLVGALPGELFLVAPEVPVRRRLLVDGAAQVEVLDDALGREREDLAHGVDELRLVDLARPLGVGHHGDG